MARKLDWFPLYASVFLTDEAVRFMSAHQVGCYTIWLCHQWINGSIPAEKSQAFQVLQPWLSALSETGEYAEAEAVLDRCFPPGSDDPNRRQNRRLEEVRAEQLSTRERLSEAGRKGGRPKGEQSMAGKPGLSIPAKPSFAVEKNRVEKKKEKKELRGAPPAAGWTALAGDAWQAERGRPNYGRIGKTLAPLVARYGAVQVLAAWRGYLDSRRGKPFASAEDFAAHYLVHRDAHALAANDDGVLAPIPDQPEEVVA